MEDMRYLTFALGKGRNEIKKFLIDEIKKKKKSALPVKK